jgi:adenylate cyclase class 2
MRLFLVEDLPRFISFESAGAFRRPGKRRGRSARFESGAFAILSEVGGGTKQPPAGMSDLMARETEIKLKINDVAALRRLLKRIGARLAIPGIARVHEVNVIFDTPQGGLAKHGQLLRIRTETAQASGKSETKARKPRVVLTFKQPVPQSADALPENGAHFPYKVREEIEAEVADSANLTRIFEGLGMSGWFRYEKYRTTFRMPASKAWAKGLLIELDETPIGTFVELEGPASAIDRGAHELGYSKRDYVLKNYLTLYAEECRRKGEQPSHMLFSKTK